MKENLFKSLTSGNMALIKRSNNYEYCFADNSMYLIDDWESDIKSGRYFIEISKYIIPIDLIKSSVIDLKNSEIEDDFRQILFWKLPCIFIDFDTQLILNNFYDQAIENRIPDYWKGKFIELKDDFLITIPQQLKFWIIDNQDYSK